MFNQTTKLSSNSGNQAIAYHSNTKSLGGATNQNQAANADLGVWIEQAQTWFNWYQGVTAGTIPLKNGEKMPTQAEYAQMTEYYQWATGQGGATNWDPSAGGQRAPIQAAPAGGKVGPLGNIVFNTEKAETDYQPSAAPVDVLSDEFTLNVNQKVQDVVVEKTTDTRLNPATEVIKITVKDRFSVPAETVYFVQPDAKINVNTIGSKGVTQHGTEALKLTDGAAQVTIGSASEPTADGVVQVEASMDGVEMKGVEDKTTGQLTYKPKFDRADNKIDFFALPGKDQTHVVSANANIACTTGDKANVRIDASGNLVIEITHEADEKNPAATKDTYIIKPGYDLSTLNINKANVTFTPGSTDGKIPVAIGARLAIPGMEKATAAPAGASPPLTSNYVLKYATTNKSYITDLAD